MLLLYVSFLALLAQAQEPKDRLIPDYSFEGVEPYVSDGPGVKPIDMEEIMHPKGQNITSRFLEQLYLAHSFAAAAYCDDNTRLTKDYDRDDHITCNTKACGFLTVKKHRFKSKFHHLGAADATGYVAIDEGREKIIVAFRGSASLQNDFADAEFMLRPAYQLCKACWVVTGFDIFWQAARSEVMNVVGKIKKEKPNYTIDVVGHSLGGAVATLAAAYLRTQGWKVNLYSFSSPRVGNAQFAKFVSSIPPHEGLNYRVTHLDDWVPKIPPHTLCQHIAGEYHFTNPNQESVELPGDVTFWKGFQFGESYGGNGFTATTDFTFHSHSWIFDNITECAPDLFDLKFLHERDLADINQGILNPDAWDSEEDNLGPSEYYDDAGGGLRKKKTPYWGNRWWETAQYEWLQKQKHKSTMDNALIQPPWVSVGDYRNEQADA